MDDFSHFAWTSLGYIGLAVTVAIAALFGLSVVYAIGCRMYMALRIRALQRRADKDAADIKHQLAQTLETFRQDMVLRVQRPHGPSPVPRRPNGTDLSRLRVGEHRLGRSGSPPSNGAA